jgi:hypothetical protein
MTRILLGQLMSNGDCLYATTVARQIKTDYPGCHLTWGISSLCRDVIKHNPDVDEVWEVQTEDWGEMASSWHAFQEEAWARVARGDFDHAFMTQISPSNFHNYDGTIRSSILRNYPRPITVPVEAIIEISPEERAHTEEWIWTNDIDAFGNVVLFECSSKSGQSFLTPEFALQVAKLVVEARADTCVVLSTHLPFETNHPNIKHGGALGMRETALLTHYADIFVGCGSGLTVVATSSAAKRNLPNIQILSAATSIYASFKHDFEYFGKPNNHFLETTKESSKHIAKIIHSVFDDGIIAARRQYGETLPLTFDWYFELIEKQLLRKRRYIDAAHSLKVTAERYGWTRELHAFAKIYVEPFLDMDPLAAFPHRRREIESFRDSVSTQMPA